MAEKPFTIQWSSSYTWYGRYFSNICQKKVGGALSVVYGWQVSKGGAYYANGGDFSLTLSLPLPPSFPLTLPSPVKGYKGRLLTHTYQHKPSLSLLLAPPLSIWSPPLGPAWACSAPISTA